MYFGVDYHPEQWVFPYGGSAENPEAEWLHDVELMVKAGINVVRIGEFTWGLCEPEDGKFDFTWLNRVMDILGQAGIQVVLATPTAAPPIWLTEKHPEILPLDEHGRVKHAGTRRAVCLNSEAFWNHSKRIVEEMAKALGPHPQLIAWQIDNGLGGNFTEAAFNEASSLDWHGWLEAKYRNHQAAERNDGSASLGPGGHPLGSGADADARARPLHNPALVLDWKPVLQRHHCAVRQNASRGAARSDARPPGDDEPARPHHRFDHFDLAEAIDFVSIESTAAIKAKPSEIACEIDMLRSLKKEDIKHAGRRHGILGDGAKGGQRQLAGRQFPGAARRVADVHLSARFARGDGHSFLPLAPAAHSARKNSTAPSCRTTRGQHAAFSRRFPKSARN